MKSNDFCRIPFLGSPALSRRNPGHLSRLVFPAQAHPHPQGRRTPSALPISSQTAKASHPTAGGLSPFLLFLPLFPTLPSNSRRLQTALTINGVVSLSPPSNSSVHYRRIDWKRATRPDDSLPHSGLFFGNTTIPLHLKSKTGILVPVLPKARIARKEIRLRPLSMWLSENSPTFGNQGRPEEVRTDEQRNRYPRCPGKGP